MLFAFLETIFTPKRIQKIVLLPMKKYIFFFQWMLCRFSLMQIKNI
jgi:hypothetical protein